MPQTRRVLNALAAVGRRTARGFRRRPADPGERLDPTAFLAHVAALAAKAPTPGGLWVSFLVDGAVDPAKAARLAAAWPKSGPAELLIGEPRLQSAAERLDEALGRARAPFVARLDLSGKLAPYAAERIADALAANPDAQLLYTDEILTDRAGRLAEVALKPAFDPILLESFDYFGRLTVFRRERLSSLGGWRVPADDYTLALRYSEGLPSGAILHLPYPAFVGPPKAFDPQKGAAAIEARYRANGLEVGFAPTLAPDRLRPERRRGAQAWPKVSVIIPNRDTPALLEKALEGLFAATDYPDFEIIVVDNGSTDPRTLALYSDMSARGTFRADLREEPFNFSRAINRGFALSHGSLALLLNNDVEVVEPGWLKEMVSCLDYPETGVVGAKLLYPDQTLQHVGVIAGLGGYAGHWHIGKPADDLGPQRRLAARQSLSVVTGACMLVSRACFERVGGFDEATFPIAYNDVDFCLRAGAAHFRVVWTPFAKLVHHESASRGSDETPENRERFDRDKAALRGRHHTDVLEDRAYNPWAVRGHSDPWPVARAVLPQARG